MAENLFYCYSLGLIFFCGVINALSTCSQKFMSLYWVLVFLKNRNRPSSRTVRLTELEKRDHHPTLLVLPGLQTLFFTFTMRSVQNGVDLVELSICYKSEKMSGQTVQPKNIKTVALLYFIMAA